MVTRISNLHVCIYWKFGKGPLVNNNYIKAGGSFCYFLELVRKLQSTRSPKLTNWFWWFLVQNEAGVLLVSFRCSVYYFSLLTLVKNKQTLQEKSRNLLLARFFAIHDLNPVFEVGYRTCGICIRIIARYLDMIKRICNTTGRVCAHQISSQSEHFGNMHAEKNVKPRNQITYHGTL